MIKIQMTFGVWNLFQSFLNSFGFVPNISPVVSLFFHVYSLKILFLLFIFYRKLQVSQLLPTGKWNWIRSIDRWSSSRYVYWINGGLEARWSIYWDWLCRKELKKWNELPSYFMFTKHVLHGVCLCWIPGAQSVDKTVQSINSLILSFVHVSAFFMDIFTSYSPNTKYRRLHRHWKQTHTQTYFPSIFFQAISMKR